MTIVRATDITWHQSLVDRTDRARLLDQRGCTLWFTGLPSAGKSTVAFALEYELIRQGYFAYVLDGANIRRGLNKNLGFSAGDREENIRRIGEVAKLFADAGAIVLTSLTSSYRKDRDRVRQLHAEANLGFVEIFIDTPLAVCEERDLKGLYRKARLGKIKGFTGVDDAYEPPLSPELVVWSVDRTPEEIVSEIMVYLQDFGYLNHRRHAVIGKAVGAN